MVNLPTIKPKVKLFGLVRDADGHPNIDDPSTLPPEVIALMTTEERAEFGVTLPIDWEKGD